MNIENLKSFLLDANEAGYASGNENSWIKEDDGSTTIPFESGAWRLHDNFFGGEPFGGREVVFYEEKPYWMMVYYGGVDQTYEDVNVVYGMLRSALKHPDADLPVRGPKKLVEGNFTYMNDYEKSLDQFSGDERILEDEREIYYAKYAGGLVDKREGI